MKIAPVVNYQTQNKNKKSFGSEGQWAALFVEQSRRSVENAVEFVLIGGNPAKKRLYLNSVRALTELYDDFVRKNNIVLHHGQAMSNFSTQILNISQAAKNESNYFSAIQALELLKKVYRNDKEKFRVLVIKSRYFDNIDKEIAELKAKLSQSAQRK